MHVLFSARSRSRTGDDDELGRAAIHGGDRHAAVLVLVQHELLRILLTRLALVRPEVSYLNYLT